MTNSASETPNVPVPRQAARRTGSRGAQPLSFHWLAGLGAAAAAGILIGAVTVRNAHNAAVPLIRVNGKALMRSNFEARLQDAGNAKTLVRQMIEDELALQFAAQKRVTITKAQTDALYEQERRRPNFERNRRHSGQTEDDIKRDLGIKFARLYAATRGLSATEEEVKQTYALNVRHDNPTAAYYLPERVEVSVIITSVLADAQKAMAELKKGMPFGLAAHLYSQDPSKDNAGMLPLVQRRTSILRSTPGLEDALFKLEVGDQIGPRQLGGGWWIVRCLDKRPEVTTEFAAVEDECRMLTLLNKLTAADRKRVEHEFTAFEKAAHLQPFNKAYKRVVQDVRNQPD